MRSGYRRYFGGGSCCATACVSRWRSVSPMHYLTWSFASPHRVEGDVVGDDVKGAVSLYTTAHWLSTPSALSGKQGPLAPQTTRGALPSEHQGGWGGRMKQKNWRILLSNGVL